MSLGYAGAHHRVTRARGPATDHLCVACGDEAQCWALRPDARTVMHGIKRDSRRPDYTWHAYWSPNPDDYWPLCWSDHKSLDRTLTRDQLVAYAAALAQSATAARVIAAEHEDR